MRRLAVLVSLVAFSLAFGGPAPQVPEDPDGGRSRASSVCSQEGQEALDAGDLARARQEFRQRAETARRRGDIAEGAACSFYLGFVAQTEAKQGPEALRRERLAEAAEWYESALPAKPQSPGLVANLARVYSDLGQRQRAGKLYEESLAKMSGGARAALAGIYARFLAEEDWNRSVEFYRQVIKAAPADDRAWDELLSLFRRKAPAQLPDEIWKAVEAGQTESAHKAALTALNDSSLQERTRIGLLAALVAGLAEQHYSVDKFAGSDLAGGLKAFKADRVIGPGVEEVLLAHQASNLNAKTFDWWAEKKTPRQRSPLSAFRLLLRSLALRADPEDPLMARAYLETAEKLSPETFDPLLAQDLLTNYAATGDTEKILSSARRWEPLLRQASGQFDPDAVQRYQLTLQAVRPSGGGGGGGGGRDRMAYHFQIGRCIPAPSSRCEMDAVRLEVPDLFFHPEGSRNGIRIASIEVGCNGRHLLGHHVVSSQVIGSGVQTASFTRSRQQCRRVSLAAQPAWLSSAAWIGGTHLLLADSLRGQLLRYATDGTLLDADPPSMPDGDTAFVRVQSSPLDGPVAENGLGRLFWRDVAAPRREAKLVGRTGSGGTVVSLVQWGLLGREEALAIANLEKANGDGISAVVRLPLSGGGYEILHPINGEKPASILYRAGSPALASAAGAGYFLALEQDEIGLYRVPVQGEPQRLITISEIEPELREELARNQDMRQAPDLLRLLERTSLPAGLYGVGDDLFLLGRIPKEKHPGWVLSQLDPRTGRTLRTVRLPTAAPHLTVAPGENSWAFFEKSSVPALGRQATPSMLLVPTVWIQGRHTAAESGCDSGILLTASASPRLSPPPPAGP